MSNKPFRHFSPIVLVGYFWWRCSPVTTAHPHFEVPRTSNVEVRTMPTDTRGGGYQPGAGCELVVHAHEGEAEELVGLETDETSGDEEGESDTVINHVWV